MEKKDNDDAAGGSTPPPPPPANGKFPLIKIKIPRKAEEAATAAAVGEEVKSHYCKECNKSFSSGKALGGHMSSAHVQANKDYSSKTKLSSSKRKSPASYSGSPNNTCDLCGKKFHSKKSLFGHMRCHPERDWRGMEPPPEPRIDSADASSEDDDEAGDHADGSSSGRHELGFTLMGWPTSKRGRGPVTSAAAGGDSGSEKEPIVAGLQLLKMLNGGESRKEEDDPKIPRIDGNGKGKEKVMGRDQDLDIDPNDELVITAIQVLATGKRESDEKRALMEETTSFKCSECERFFSTHQALGGHRSSHNKFKMSVVNTITRPTNPETPVKRKAHNKKEKEKAVVKTIEARASEVAAFAFDLNVAPAEEEEDEDEDIRHSSNSS